MTPDEAKAAYLAERERHNNTIFGDRKTQHESWMRMCAAMDAWRVAVKERWGKG